MRPIALCLSLLLTAGLELRAQSPDNQLLREIFAQLLEINTAVDSGETTSAAKAMAARLRAAGFADSDIQVLGPAPHKHNLVVRYRGTGKQKPLLLLAHLDVVEAKRTDWTLEPFQLTEKDGFFYGRGTGDQKAMCAIWVANLIRWKREGYKPDRDLIVALTADEEGGKFNGVEWLVKNHRSLIDSELCINEGGFGESKDGKRLYNQVQVAEKYVVTYQLTVRNKGGHSSMPVKENAIYRLSAALDRLGKFEFPVKLNDVTREYFERMSSRTEPRAGAAMRQLLQGSATGASALAEQSPYWNSTMRTTCVATRLEGGHADNALPQTALATVNCRVLPEQTEDDVRATLRKVFADEQVEIAFKRPPSPGPASPMRPDVMQATERVTARLFPGVLVVPTMLTGATDGKYLRAAGIPTYGVSGIFFDMDDIRWHGRDERVGVQDLYDGREFLYQLVKELSGPTR
jgi:acetylornithine deacetylase/succinyl-diaminopimelate desuccinylase-like protein